MKNSTVQQFVGRSDKSLETEKNSGAVHDLEMSRLRREITGAKAEIEEIYAKVYKDTLLGEIGAYCRPSAFDHRQLTNIRADQAIVLLGLGSEKKHIDAYFSGTGKKHVKAFVKYYIDLKRRLGLTLDGFNDHNRDPSVSDVSSMVDIILRGEFCMTPQGIIMSRDMVTGALMATDGGHRLLSIILADVPVTLDLTIAPMSTIAHIDQGRKRQENVALSIKLTDVAARFQSKSLHDQALGAVGYFSDLLYKDGSFSRSAPEADLLNMVTALDRVRLLTNEKEMTLVDFLNDDLRSGESGLLFTAFESPSKTIRGMSLVETASNLGVAGFVLSMYRAFLANANKGRGMLDDGRKVFRVLQQLAARHSGLKPMERECRLVRDFDRYRAFFLTSGRSRAERDFKIAAVAMLFQDCLDVGVSGDGAFGAFGGFARLIQAMDDSPYMANGGNYDVAFRSDARFRAITDEFMLITRMEANDYAGEHPYLLKKHNKRYR